ncbi:MAG TPA: hypothetical protein ENI89_00060 [Desulfobulbus sp.]|nr:hypothetical protein [Desulfobulbus sp.]
MDRETLHSTSHGGTDDCTELAAAFLAELKRYCANRLRTAVAQGVIRRGMYSADDLTDEVYLRVCRQAGKVGPEDLDRVKIEMFRTANTLLDEIINTESVSLQGLNIGDVLRDELRALEEKYTIDAEGELIPYEDLDDISYQQEKEGAELQLLEPGFEDELIKALDLEESVIRADDRFRHRLASLYLNLPAMSRILLDLSTRGGLTVEEIARVCTLETEEVRQTITLVRRHFHAAGLGRS